MPRPPAAAADEGQHHFCGEVQAITIRCQKRNTEYDLQVSTGCMWLAGYVHFLSGLVSGWVWPHEWLGEWPHEWPHEWLPGDSSMTEWLPEWFPVDSAFRRGFVAFRRATPPSAPIRFRPLI